MNILGAKVFGVVFRIFVFFLKEFLQKIHFCIEKEKKEDEEENERGRDRERGLRAANQKFEKSFFVILSDLKQAEPIHLADESQTCLTLVCEVIRSRLVKVLKITKKVLKRTR